MEGQKNLLNLIQHDYNQYKSEQLVEPYNYSNNFEILNNESERERETIQQHTPEYRNRQEFDLVNRTETQQLASINKANTFSEASLCQFNGLELALLGMNGTPKENINELIKNF